MILEFWEFARKLQPHWSSLQWWHALPEPEVQQISGVEIAGSALADPFLFCLTDQESRQKNTCRGRRVRQVSFSVADLIGGVSAFLPEMREEGTFQTCDSKRYR